MNIKVDPKAFMDSLLNDSLMSSLAKENSSGSRKARLLISFANKYGKYGIEAFVFLEDLQQLLEKLNQAEEDI